MKLSSDVWCHIVCSVDSLHEALVFRQLSRSLRDLCQRPVVRTHWRARWPLDYMLWCFTSGVDMSLQPRVLNWSALYLWILELQQDFVYDPPWLSRALLAMFTIAAEEIVILCLQSSAEASLLFLNRHLPEQRASAWFPPDVDRCCDDIEDDAEGDDDVGSEEHSDDSAFVCGGFPSSESYATDSSVSEETLLRDELAAGSLFAPFELYPMWLSMDRFSAHTKTLRQTIERRLADNCSPYALVLLWQSAMHYLTRCADSSELAAITKHFADAGVDCSWLNYLESPAERANREYYFSYVRAHCSIESPPDDMTLSINLDLGGDGKHRKVLRHNHMLFTTQMAADLNEAAGSCQSFEVVKELVRAVFLGLFYGYHMPFYDENSMQFSSIFRASLCVNNVLAHIW